MALPRKWHFRLCLAQAVGPSRPRAHPSCLTSGFSTPRIAPFPSSSPPGHLLSPGPPWGLGGAAEGPILSQDGEAGEEKG